MSGSRLSSLLLSLGLLTLSIAFGCTTAPLKTAEISPNIRTVAAIGDRSLPLTTGSPGSTAVAEAPAASPRRKPSGERVSGRVVDQEGRPVPNARVQLAIGGVSGGQIVRDTTDAAGGFTLQGLSPGKTYTIIAKAKNGEENLVGRRLVSVPNHNIEISLRDSVQAEAEPRNRPRRIERVSDRSRNDDDSYNQAEDDAGIVRKPSSSRLNSEDIPDRSPDNATEDPIPQTTPRTNPAVPMSGWHGQHQTSSIPPANSSGSSTNTRDPETITSSDFDDDAPNPLPPAIEHLSSSPRVIAGRDAGDPRMGVAGGADAIAESPGSPRSKHRPGELIAADLEVGGSRQEVGDARQAENPRPVRRIRRPVRPQHRTETAEQNGERPQEHPAELHESKSADQIPADLLSTPEEKQASASPAQETVAAAQETAVPAREAVPPASSALVEADAKDPLPDEATPAKIEAKAAPEPVQQPEPPDPASAPAPALAPAPSSSPRKAKMTWGELEDLTGVAAAADPTAVATRNTPANMRARIARAPLPANRSAESHTDQSAIASTSQPVPTSATRSQTAAVNGKGQARDEAVEFCQFDPQQHRVIDFGMRDLNGKQVRFRDLDADLVLLDFWGSWCGPCLTTIPHLVELQKKYESKVRVVGLAYEDGSLAQRIAAAGGAATQHAINYPILIAGLEGPCPLHQALNVQNFPTMVLLARDGRILWRDQGADPATLSRLDHALEAALKPVQTAIKPVDSARR